MFKRLIIGTALCLGMSVAHANWTVTIVNVSSQDISIPLGTFSTTTSPTRGGNWWYGDMKDWNISFVLKNNTLVDLSITYSNDYDHSDDIGSHIFILKSNEDPQQAARITVTDTQNPKLYCENDSGSTGPSYCDALKLSRKGDHVTIVINRPWV